MKVILIIVYCILFNSLLYSQDEKVEENKLNNTETTNEEQKNKKIDENSVPVEQNVSEEKPETTESDPPPEPVKKNYSIQINGGVSQSLGSNYTVKALFTKYINNFGLSIGTSGYSIGYKNDLTLREIVILDNLYNQNNNPLYCIYYWNYRQGYNPDRISTSTIDFGISYHFFRGEFLEPFAMIGLGYGNYIDGFRTQKAFADIGTRLNFSDYYLGLSIGARSFNLSKNDLEDTIIDFPAMIFVGVNF